MKNPCRLEYDSRFIYHHLPVTGGGDTPDSPEDVRKTYFGMLDAQMDNIADTIINADTKMMFFCGAGKDRTGVVSAVVLNRLGVDDKKIVEDYMKTKDNLMDFLNNYVRENPEVDIKTVVPDESNIKAVLKD